MRRQEARPRSGSSRAFTPIVALTTGVALSVLVQIANEWGDEVTFAIAASIMGLLTLISSGLKLSRLAAPESLVIIFWSLMLPAFMGFCAAGLFTIVGSL